MATGVGDAFTIQNQFSPGRINIVSQGKAATTTSKLGTDSGTNAGKHAVVHRHSVNGQEVDLLIRVQVDKGSIFVDVVSALSVAELTTNVAALSIAALSPGHPSPTKDAIDAQAMVAAGGS